MTVHANVLMYRNNGDGVGISVALQTKVIELGSVDKQAQSECACCGTYWMCVCCKPQLPFVLYG